MNEGRCYNSMYLENRSSGLSGSSPNVSRNTLFWRSSRNNLEVAYKTNRKSLEGTWKESGYPLDGTWKPPRWNLETPWMEPENHPERTLK
jgi:hypothetical protein